MAIRPEDIAVPPSKAPEEDVSPYQKSMQEYAAQKASLFAIQNNLMRELESRRVQPADKLMAFSQAMLTPGRTGNFGEAFGGAMGALQKTEAEEIARSQALAKMRMELGVQQLGMKKEDIDLAKRKMLSDSISKTLGGEGRAITGLDALSLANRAGLQNGPTNAAASIIGQRAATSPSDSVYNQLDPTTREMIRQQSIVDPEGAQKSLITFGLDASKMPDAIKAANYWIQTMPPEVQGSARAYLANTSVYGDRAVGAKTIIEIGQAMRKGEITPADGNNLMKSFIQQATGSSPQEGPPQITGQRGTDTSSLQGDPQDVMRSIASIPDLAERNRAMGAFLNQGAPRQAGVALTQSTNNSEIDKLPPAERDRLKADQIRRAQELEEKEVQTFKTSVVDAYKGSSEKISDVNTLIGLTERSPNAFAYFTKPTVQNAITSLVEGGVLGLKVPQIKDALLKFGATTEEIDTLRTADYISIRQQLVLGQMMKGAVSNFERELVGRAVITPDDSVNVVRWKANIIKARAMADREIYDLYRKNPNMTEFNFIGTPEYDAIKSKLDERLVRNNAVYGIKMDYAK